MRTRKAKDTRKLIQAALGQIPCDLTISNIRLLNVFTGEIYPASVDVLDGFVVRVREEGVEAAVPAREGSRFAYISSGTWSLLGAEIDKPLSSVEVMNANYTNEGGINGTTRLLKNIR